MSSRQSETSDESSSSPGGASALLDIFRPPTSLEEENSEKKETSSIPFRKPETNAESSPGEASALLDMFRPPTSLEEENSEKIETSSISFRKTETRAESSPGEASALLNVFRPPTSLEAENSEKIEAIVGKEHEDEELSERRHGTHLKCKSPQRKTLTFSKIQEIQTLAEVSPPTNCNSSVEQTPLSKNSKKCYESIPLPPRSCKWMENITKTDRPKFTKHETCSFLHNFAKENVQPATFIGGFVSVLFQIVSCLAMASTIPGTSVGTMIMMTASGILISGPIFTLILGGEIPAMNPNTDLFLSPFLAQLASGVLESLERAGCDSEPVTFLATFSVLSGLGFLLSGILILLSSRFKLANLASYLPFPVLCGFFAAVGVSLWFLAVTVDTGLTVRQVLSTKENIQLAIMHHVPSLVVGCIMKIYASKSTFMILYIVGATIIIFYSLVFITGASVEQAQLNGWLWSASDLVVHYDGYQPPAPFAILFSLHHVHWASVLDGLETAIALSFVYLLRCSLHAVVVKKNVRTLKQIITKKQSTSKEDANVVKVHKRRFTEVVDIESSPFIGNNIKFRHDQKDVSEPTTEKVVISAKVPTIPIEAILNVFSYVEIVAGIVGSFPSVPSPAIMSTLYSLGAGKRVTHYFSLILFSIFYFTKFELVAYIPKMVFSSLVIVAFLELTWVWGVQSYFKIKEKTEWMLVPAIILCTFFVGLLNAIFVGVGLSTFVFVAALLRSGVVKYLSSGLIIRSTIERTLDAQNWLDTHGDKIQIVVLQNYLFFGNASSMLEYVINMFEEQIDNNAMPLAPSRPFPKYIILDFALVTGMDTSTIDVFNDIRTICCTNNCRLYISGLPPSLRENLALGGFRPEGGERSNRIVRFFIDLDTAVGKAEDNLLVDEMVEMSNDLKVGDITNLNDQQAFQRALNAIDEQQGTDFASGLSELFPHTTLIHLEAGDTIFSSNGGTISDDDRGIFFIASGIIKIEHSSNMSLTRGGKRSYGPAHSFSAMQRCNFHANKHNHASSVRLARIGPGWIIGGFDTSVTQNAGNHVAVTNCLLYHLPLYRVEEIEEKSPRLILRLHKLLSFVTARRQEVTIGQLLTLRSIMASPNVQKPLSKPSMF